MCITLQTWCGINTRVTLAQIYFPPFVNRDIDHHTICNVWTFLDNLLKRSAFYNNNKQFVLLHGKIDNKIATLWVSFTNTDYVMQHWSTAQALCEAWGMGCFQRNKVFSKQEKTIFLFVSGALAVSVYAALIVKQMYR